ncbi:unnamed protein product, partial [Prorocentrum cordatum]
PQPQLNAGEAQEEPTPTWPTSAQHAAHRLWHPEWAEAAGEKTVRSRSSRKRVRLYCSWFCPFAQRAWIACEAKGLDHQYVEIEPYELDEREPGGYTKRQLPISVKRQRYPDFVAASPRGLVPAMDAYGELLSDSLPLCEYIDEKFDGPPLLPPRGSALARASVRIWIAHCAEHIQKPYYTLLMEQEPARREAAQAKMLDGVRALAAAMAPAASGPFFLGAQFSLFEVALAPFWQRYIWVGSHYRGLAFPDLEPPFERMAAWWAAVEAHPAVSATLVCRARLVSSYTTTSATGAPPTLPSRCSQL